MIPIRGHCMGDVLSDMRRRQRSPRGIMFDLRETARWCNTGSLRVRPRFSRPSVGPFRLASRRASWFVAGTLCRSTVVIRSDTLQKLEQVTARGKDKSGVCTDDGFIGLQGPCEIIELHRRWALVVSLRIDLGRFRVRHAADFLDLPVGLGLDLVQITHTITANSGGLAVTFRQVSFRDLPPLADHSVIDLRAHAYVVVDSLEPDIQQFDTKHPNLLGGRGKDLLLDHFTPLL